MCPMSAFGGKADIHCYMASTSSSAFDPKRTLGWTEGEYLPIVERANFTVEIFDADAVEVSDADTP